LGQAFPGWDPLADPGPLPLRAGGSLARWWWPISAIVAFLTVVGYVLGHDPQPGLSNRGWLTITLAAVVVMLLTVHRAGRGGPPRTPLARALAEYAVVALLTLLLATAGADRPPAQQVEDQADQQSTERPADRRQAAGQADAAPGRSPPRHRARGHRRGSLAGRAVARRKRTGRPPPALDLHHHIQARRPGPDRPHPTDPEVPHLMWSSLPSNLRTVLGTALLLGVGVAVAAFTLSFFALRDAAADPALAWGQGHAWLFPIGVDMALVFFEILLLGASMVRIQEHGRVVQYPRAVPFLLVLVAAAGTLYFNATHVPEQVRPIALAVPVASILVTLGLAYLLKMLAAASGNEAIHLAPPPLEPHRIVRSRDVLHAELVRDPEFGTAQAVPGGGWPPGPDGQVAAGHRLPENPHNGQAGLPVGDRGDPAGVTKRARIEAYLDRLGSEQLRHLTLRELTSDLNQHGLDVTERYVKQVIDQRRPTHPRRRGSGTRTPRR
jgi:hypothetical protein